MDDQIPQYDATRDDSPPEVLLARPVTDMPVMPYAPTAPPRPRVWTIFVMYLVVMVVAQVVAAVVLFAILIAMDGLQALHAVGADLPEKAFSRPPVLLGVMASTSVVLTAFSFMAAALSGRPWRARLRLSSPRLTSSATTVAVVGMIALSTLLMGVMNLTPGTSDSILNTIAEMIQRLSPAGLIAGVLVIGVAPGIGEELFFRGYVQTRLTQRWGVTLSILVTSLLFAILHMDLVQGAFALAMGIYLGAVTERAGSIIPAMLCHAGSNAFSTIMTAAGIEIVGREANLTLIAVSGVVLSASALYVRGRRALISPAGSQPPEIH